MQDETKITEVKPVVEEQTAGLQFFESRVQAGLITNPAATFCARVIGNSMVDAGINEGDLLIIDRSLTPHDGNIAVCFVDGDFTVKRLSVRDDGVYLTPANAKFPELKVSDESNFQVWGVVSHIIKRL